MWVGNMKNTEVLDRLISVATGEKKASLVIKNARILNVFTQELEEGDLAIEAGYIAGIGYYEGEQEVDVKGKTIVPGFIDAHMHLESSIVSPSQYATAVAPHGTTAIVADPHEIGNVCGTKGIDYILKATEKLPIDAYIMIPSCVPATHFDETGFTLGVEEVSEYLGKDRVLGLAEMMNFPGVLMKDSQVLGKISATHQMGKIVDGHAPGLADKSLCGYTAAGVYSDHECTAYDEALAKVKRGQWVFLRQGTASRNLESLIGLCKEPYFRRCAFCTDDKHPGELVEDGHIDYIIRLAIEKGVDPVIAYTIASYNAATYFGLKEHGAICPGYRADFVILDDYEKVIVGQVYKNGVKVAENGRLTSVACGDDVSEGNSLGGACGGSVSEGNSLDVTGGSSVSEDNSLGGAGGSSVSEGNSLGVTCSGGMTDELLEAVSDTVHIGTIRPSDLVIEGGKAKVIGLVDGEIITTDEGEAEGVDVQNDILKLAVVERHHNTGHIGLCYVKNYGLKKGAVATTVAHDSHNIIVVGTNDEDMATAIMELKNMGGGMIVVENGKILASLCLPIAGLMCDLPVLEAQSRMDEAKAVARDLGVREAIDPFMTLSFASLSVIPTLRLTTLGVVDVNRFELI